MRTIRPTQWQPTKLQDSFEMSEEHLDLLAILARLLVSIGLGNVASDIPCGFMDAASDLPNRVCWDNNEPSCWGGTPSIPVIGLDPGGGTWHRFFYSPTYDVFGIISHANEPTSSRRPERDQPLLVSPALSMMSSSRRVCI